MCFSAIASFTASAIIGTTGVITLRKCESSNERYFGSIPLLFAFQQLLEGLIWLSFKNPSLASIQTYATTGFLLFAWVVWPILLPFSVLQLETQILKKKVIKIFSLFSIIYGLLALIKLLNGSVTATQESFHIGYVLSTRHVLNDIPYLWEGAYLLLTVIPLFISTTKGVRFLAFANLGSLLITFTFFNQTLPSVWCFFAAFLSIIIYFIIKNKSKPTDRIEAPNCH